jgi:hypothetical protein
MNTGMPGVGSDMNDQFIFAPKLEFIRPASFGRLGYIKKHNGNHVT